MQNLDIRRAAAAAGVRLWEVAERLGMADSSLSRKLRRELSEEDKARVYAAIAELAKEAAR